MCQLETGGILYAFLEQDRSDERSTQMTAIIDYGAGNIKSVEKALLSLGQEVVITDDKETILNADRIILPGVGAFGDAMAQLEKTGLDAVIREAVEKNIPFLGICLGLQLLFEKSEEAPGVKGLGILKGEVKKIPAVIREAVEKNIPFLGICLGLQLLFEKSEEAPGVKGLGILKGEVKKIPAEQGLKIPHMGWNSLHFAHDGKLFHGIEEGSYVYFVHSYYLKAEEEFIVKASTEYGVSIHASVEKDNVFACQFHPEKSSETGLKILKNFVEL